MALHVIEDFWGSKIWSKDFKKQTIVSNWQNGRSEWRRDRIKGLYWEGDGFVLVYKRLERGSFQWPRNGDEALELSAQQYRWLMEGLSVEQPKAHKPISGLKI